MEKTEIRPLFQLMASWPKKSNFEGVKTFLVPKKFWGYPTLGFLTLKSTKKMTIFIKNQNWTSILIHRLLAQKIQLWGCQIFLGPKICLMYSILVFLTLESTKKWFVFIKNIKKFACWNIANFVMLLMKTNGTFKGHKS